MNNSEKNGVVDYVSQGELDIGNVSLSEKPDADYDSTIEGCYDSIFEIMRIIGSSFFNDNESVDKFVDMLFEQKDKFRRSDFDAFMWDSGTAGFEYLHRALDVFENHKSKASILLSIRGLFERLSFEERVVKVAYAFDNENLRNDVVAYLSPIYVKMLKHPQEVYIPGLKSDFLSTTKVLNYFTRYIRSGGKYEPEKSCDLLISHYCLWYFIGLLSRIPKEEEWEI